MTARWSTIRQAIPALHDLPEDEPPRIDSGQNAIAWDAVPFIVRVPRHDAEGRSLHREVAILRVIGPLLPIPTPEITLFTLPDGTTAALHRALPGEPLMTIPDDVPGTVAMALGEFLGRLHAIPHWELDGIALPVANRGHWRSWLRDARHRLGPHLDPAALQQLGDAGAAFLDGLDTVSPVLIHGDFGGSNILAQDGTITGIIDFGSAHFGDPASDLAGLVASYGEPILDRLEPAYPLAAEPGIRHRIAFYRLAFAAMDALHGLEHRDEAAFRAGVAGVTQLAAATRQT